MAEQTRQDSAAMKTIAVLTLTFLPGTAVAVSVEASIFVATRIHRRQQTNTVTHPVLFLHERHVQLGPGGWTVIGVAVPVCVFRGDHPADGACVCGLVVVVPPRAAGVQEAV